MPLIDTFGLILAGCACIILLCVTAVTIAFTITVVKGFLDN